LSQGLSGFTGYGLTMFDSTSVQGRKLIQSLDNRNSPTQVSSDDSYPVGVSISDSDFNAGVVNSLATGKGIVVRNSQFAYVNGAMLQEDKATNPNNYQVQFIPDTTLSEDIILVASNQGIISVERNVKTSQTGSLVLGGALATIPTSSHVVAITGIYQAEFSGVMNIDEVSETAYEIQLGGVTVAGSQRTITMSNHTGSAGNEDRTMVAKTIEFGAAVGQTIDCKAVLSAGSGGLVRAGGLMNVRFIRE